MVFVVSVVSAVNRYMKSLTEKYSKYLKYFKLPALGAGFILVFLIAYYPFSVNIHKMVAVGPPARTFLMFWMWREWVSIYFVRAYLHARPFSLWNLIYYGILSNGSLPETGNVSDILFISYPLKQWFSLSFPLYYNIKFIIILLFNSFAGYFAIRRITKREDAGIICGVFMAVNPFLVMMLAKARLRAGILGFAILCIYYLYELTRKPDIKTAILCGLFLGLSSIFYAFYGIFLLWIIAFVFIGKAVLELFRKKPVEIWRFFKMLMVVFVAFAIIVLPWMVPYFTSHKKESGEYQAFGVKFFRDLPTPEEIFDPDFLNNPDNRSLHPLRLIMVEQMPLRFYFPVFFSLFAMFAFFKPRPLVFLLIFIFLLFYILSLGPYLKLSENPEIQGFYRTQDGGFISLPYLLFFKYVPFISRLHHPDHFLSFSSIALLFLAGLGLTNVFNFFQKRGKLVFVNYALLIALVAYLAVGMRWYHPRTRYQMCNIEIPGQYYAIAKEPFCGIYEVPIPDFTPGMEEIYDRTEFYQSIHGKKYIQSRHPGLALQIPKPGGKPWMFPRDFDKLRRDNNRFQKYLLKCHEGEKPEYTGKDIEQVKKLGYKYVILHKSEFDRASRAKNRGKEEQETFNYYEMTKEHFINSGYFEFMDDEIEYPTNFIPVDDNFMDYEISVFKMR